MKRLFLLVLTAYLILPLAAQENLRSWRKGPLTWNDFPTFAKDSTGVEHSYLEFFLDIQETAEEHDGVDYWVQSAVACMDRKKSWVDSSWRTDAELRYNQVIFDLAELYRRHMQIELDTGGTPDVGQYMQLLVADVDTFCLATEFGADTAAVDLWYAFVREELAAAAAAVAEGHASKIEQIVQAEYITGQRFALGIGAGVKVPTGDLRRYFRTGGGFYMECEFGYGRQILGGGLFLGGSRCLDSLWHHTDPGQDLWKNDNLTILDLKFDYGFAVVDNNLFRLTPFVGVGLLGYYYEEPSDVTDETTFIGPSAFSIRAGVDVRYHFSTSVATYRRSSELTQIALFAKVYAEHARFGNYFGEPGGWTFNLAIGLAIHETSRERK